jgi:two-component system CheB/CheR fusion protein
VTAARPIIIGIGASAGGLEAFHGFFEHMPADSGMAFVVILHLPKTRKSMLPEILERWTAMRVIEATDGTPIEPDCVYVPPPHSIATIQDGRLCIRMPAPDAPREYRPIDDFFDSLAASMREDAIGVVLSGTGSDGSLGLKAIKEYGGTTIAQGADGTAPLYDGMPAGAIATGVVDLVAPVEAIPSHLMSLKGSRVLEIEASEMPPEKIEAARLAICAILQTQLGHDFSGYKDKTFMRRVQRRMQVLKISALDDYLAWLEKDSIEASLLFRDLLIRVTSFFRDSSTFDVIEQHVMPRLFNGKHADATIRVWVPGCATGEEVYSLAILLREQMAHLRGAPKVQIFGTDIDEPAIATARLGRYPATLLEGLSAERRNRFFHASQSGYVVTKEIRDLCTFSPHNLIQDPPFSRMDLISCRNLLIYLDVSRQNAILRAFHYALVSDGTLLLGKSESTARQEELFEPLDRAARIFQRRNVQSPSLNLPLWQSMGRPQDAEQKRPQLLPHTNNHMMAQTVDSGFNSAGKLARQQRGVMLESWMRLRSQLQTAGIYPAGSKKLHRELAETRVKLESLTEEHQAALEELRSANEELHSVNEELQSTNEELETSKEEIQSVNEELHTVNARLSEKVDELDRSNSDLKNLFDSTQIATVFLDRHLIIRSFTPAVGSIYNLIPSDQGRPLTDIVSQLRYEGLRDDVGHVLDTLEPLERRLADKADKTHYLMRILPYRAPDSSVSGTLLTFLDVSTITQAEQHQRLLVDELNHRVKNMLTVVISLATQTIQRSSTLSEFSQAFIGRVHALTASYALLAAKNWQNVWLTDVLAAETRPFAARDRENIVIKGPRVRLAPRGALAMGMAIHELLTNAVKYGALSVAEGVVNIAWRFEDKNNPTQLVIEWTECGGPPVASPSHHGFGRTLLERGIAHELAGEASLDFAVVGLRATLRVPLGTLIFAADSSSGPSL